MRQGRPVGGLDQEFIETARAGEAANGGAVEPQFTADRGQCLALGQSLLHRLVAFGGAGHQSPGATREVECPVRRNERDTVRDGRLLGDQVPGGVHLGDQGCRERGPDTAVVGADRLLQGLGEVPPRMPPVRDLFGLRGTGAGALRVGAGPVPADDLHLRVPAQPVGQRHGVPAGQHIKRPAGLQVDEDGGARIGLAQREIVHSQHSDLVRRRLGDSAKEMQEGVGS
ncbi:hypothetical protein ASD08_14580 [Streptomyces sp. Root369]|nr:hypothetical protein ASD08_14580 [Streptomyces sp. Root369]